MKKYKTIDMEIAVSNFFGIILNIIVPNISWSYFAHELDLAIITRSNYIYEIEIKVDKYDLIKDKKKKHKHRDCRIKRLYFAIPDYLESNIDHIPEDAGILIVSERIYQYKTILETIQLRKPKDNPGTKFCDKDILNFARLGSMRIWALKNKLSKYDW